MIKFRTLDGKACSSQDEALITDNRLVRERCAIISEPDFLLYKIETIHQLVPIVYGRYKFDNIKFPCYIVENVKTQDLLLVNLEDIYTALRAISNVEKKKS